ncbi:MAG: epoxyqueuosine reductase QueH [Tannerellaceae bacterium]|nr:epoxyqueuosine reductase QueH [Tannerellaceae bacterium]
MNMDSEIILHTCCATCSAAIIEWLLSNGVQPLLYYFNPNIYPAEEYLIRKSECTRYAESQGIKIIDGDYDHIHWLEEIKGLENEPERGGRCFQCFKMRLLATARISHERGIRQFATTLASSRWKSLEQIAGAGHWAASHFEDTEFLERNWRKGGLSERRRILLAENNFYNQTWCGCEFSQRLPKNE